MTWVIGTLARQLWAVAGPNQHPTKLPFINYNMPTAGRGKFADSHRQLERPIFPAVECSDRRRLGQDLQDNRHSMNTSLQEVDNVDHPNLVPHCPIRFQLQVLFPR